MRHRQNLKQCRNILAIRAMMKHEAQHALENALLAEAQKVQAEADARRETDRVVSEWTAHLERPGLDPVRLQCLAEAFDAQTRSLRLADVAANDARAVTEARRAVLFSRNADSSQAESLVDRCQRRRRRSDDEKALHMNDERLAYRWIMS